ncbi:hypothetical protein AADZ91_15095 [Colwelliaceae bacterium 6441]
MRKRIASLLILLTMLCAQVQSTEDDIVVVVNIKNSVNSMSHSQVIDMFMGKYVAFPNGEKAKPVDLDQEQLTKATFYQKLVGRSLSNINAYWSRLKFTGRIKESTQLKSEADVVNFIANNTSSIGYIPRSMTTDKLKIVYTFNE